MDELIKLVSVFFRIGLFTVGGGYAMLPMLQREVVEKYKWLTEEEILNIYAIGQSTPGIIAINVATFVGTRRKGLTGAIAATLGMVLPSLIIITLIAAFFTEFKDNAYAKSAFEGVRAAVAGLLVIIVAQMVKKAVTDILGYLLMFGAFSAIVFFKAPAIPVILLGGIIGIIYYSAIAAKNFKASPETNEKNAPAKKPDTDNQQEIEK